MKFSIIIPVYNEENAIENALRQFSGRAGHEIIVVDGYSRDMTEEIVRKYPVTFIQTRKNRAGQMNKGASAASGDVLIFLHADCVMDKQTFQAVEDTINRRYAGGCLSQRINSSGWIYRLIEFTGNIRARLFHVFYGDQAIFVRKDIFDRIGGFDDVDLFEDVIFSGKLKKHGKTRVLKNKVFSSPRRWAKQGIFKATFLNWIVTLGFRYGISPRKLKKLYFDIR